MGIMQILARFRGAACKRLLCTSQKGVRPALSGLSSSSPQTFLSFLVRSSLDYPEDWLGRIHGGDVLTAAIS